MSGIVRLFVSLSAMLLASACGRPDDPAKPPVVALPPEAAEVAVFLDPQIQWAEAYNDNVHDWGRRLMLELPVELKAHGFTMTADKQSAAALLAVRANAGTTIMAPIAVDLVVDDSEEGHGAGKVSVTAGQPEYAARMLINELVASSYLNELARRHAKVRDSD